MENLKEIVKEKDWASKARLIPFARLKSIDA
jgi:hypothetical protein